MDCQRVAISSIRGLVSRARFASVLLSGICVLLIDSSASATNSTYFPTLAPHASLPSEAYCTSAVNYNAWEPRPENASANMNIPSPSSLASFHAQPLNFIDGPPTSDFQNVDGNYSGTTDMIIRWAACKWGMDENLLRAQAFEESTWTATTTGDYSNIFSNCVAGDWNGWQPQGYCWDSYGITQVKVQSFNAWPMAWTSTAFNLDFRAAYWRACMNGDVQYYYNGTPVTGYPKYKANGNTMQMQWGCVGSWYSGAWYDASALGYITAVQNLLSNKPWRALPAHASSSLVLLTPWNNQVVARSVQITISLDQTDARACYACLSIDGVHQSCTPAVGPWTWNTTQNVLNGTHAIQVDAYQCSGVGPNYHAGIDVIVAN